MRTTHTHVPESGHSQIRKELRERDKDDSWRGEALDEAEAKEKHARRPGAPDEEKTDWLAVPKKRDA